MKIKGEFILREIAGDTILVPVGQTALQFNGMITLEPVGSLIWKDIEAGKTQKEILVISFGAMVLSKSLVQPTIG